MKNYEITSAAFVKATSL